MNKRLITATSLVAALVAISVSIPMATLVARDERAAIVAELQVEALSSALALSSRPVTEWESFIKQAPSRPEERIVIVNADGFLVADSSGQDLDRTFNRPEIQQALQGSMASDVRYSSSLQTSLRYVAAPVFQNQQVIAAVRYSLPESVVNDAVIHTVLSLALFTLAVTGVAALLAWLLAISIAGPIKRLAATTIGLPKDLSLRADTSSGPAEIREMATAFNVTANHLQELIERSERVAAEASHHLRTPLTALRLRLETIEDISNQSEVTAEVEHAVREVDRLTRRIDQVLALAKADAGSMQQETIHAASVIFDRTHSFEQMARERGITIDVSADEDLVVLADIGAVPRILDELLANSLQYAKTRINVDLHQEGERAVLVVEDDGPGVPEAELATVFERFTRGSAAVPGGTGLGLAMVRETARMCGGDARALRSALLGGLRIDVEFLRA